MKLLLAPMSPRGSFIVGTGGKLRVVDQPICHSYEACCVCPECRERAEQRDKPKLAPAPQPWQPRAA